MCAHAPARVCVCVCVFMNRELECQGVGKDMYEYCETEGPMQYTRT